jgi:DNA polymerase-3 subunit gamma/tau
VVTALYRRYRPETFAELIGQSQVTDPLRTALRTDRVNHAYLFSGPRGCGKTTSARILARCLNCAEGPTDTPCGVCPSCLELAREGSGSLDVVEIDAASHGGVDDARDLRERAIFAPARDRYKIFIVDEAHMVTSGGFNALLKIVEEPPEHVKFIFATTEPEKVISTIRSRTHHYPFRLVPPAQMLDYVQQLSETEGVAVQPGVLPLVVRAGGGSVRDTLSLLDQLIAGSEASAGTTTVEYERAVALLGYTHGALLDEVVDAVAALDAAAAFAAVDRVVQTGQDPRRFVEDLLERLRDLIVVAATRDGAASVLRGVPQDELDHMATQAASFGSAELSRAADIVNTALTEMTGATSPRLHLELMVARLLVPATDDSERGALARVERLERRVGFPEEDAAPAPADRAAPPARVETPTPTKAPTAKSAAKPPSKPALAIVPDPDPEPPAATTSTTTATATPTSTSTSTSTSTPDPSAAAPAEQPAPTIELKPVTAAQLRDAWPEVLEAVQKAAGRLSWAVVSQTSVQGLDGEVLTLGFTSESDLTSFRPVKGAAPGESVSEQLRAAILEVLGIRVKFLPRVDSGAALAPAGVAAAAAAESSPIPAAAEQAPDPDEPEPAGWNVTAIPGAAEAPAAETEPATAASAPDAGRPDAGRPDAGQPEPAGSARYGEAVVRELLKANFLEEQSLSPRDQPVPLASDEPQA